MSGTGNKALGIELLLFEGIETESITAFHKAGALILDYIFPFLARLFRAGHLIWTLRIFRMFCFYQLFESEQRKSGYVTL